jgi:Ca2+-transporting ATPase
MQQHPNPQPSNSVTTQWWTLTPEQTVSELQTDAIKGLPTTDVHTRLAQYGDNSLPEEEKQTLFLSIIAAFKDPLSLVLTLAAVLSATIGLIQDDTTELQQAGWIMGIVLFMTLVGFYTDFFADREMEKLKELQVEKATTIRNGQLLIIEAKQLVPGDIIRLGQGDKVPADARIIDSNNVTADEQLFTGEPLDREKNAALVMPPETPLAERTNMVLGGSFITAGNLTAVVTATGVTSELGKIWLDLQKTEDTITPLQAQLEDLGQMLLKGTLVVSGLVIAIYVLFQNYPLLDAAIVAVALAIAFIPEALGAIILIALALGAREMVSKQTIIREKYAAEGLGSVSIICTDKTGTITFGKMTASHLWGMGVGEIKIDQQDWQTADGDLTYMLNVVRYANNQKDATDEALSRLVEAANRPITPELRRQRKGEVPFSSFRKRLSTLDEIDGSHVLHSKGAPYIMLPLCVSVLRNGQIEPMTDEFRTVIQAQSLHFEQQGYRVLTLAQRAWDQTQHDISEDDETDMTFLGLVAISDPARPEVRGTINTLRGAGISVKMITGDSPETALSIAKDIGLVAHTADHSVVIENQELERMFKPLLAQSNGKSVSDLLSQDQLDHIESTSIFSRVTPADKVTIISALQRNGALVAMVGDGVNDAASIKQANIGIAMASGTELAKAVSRAVLTGSYDAIASAVQVGRTILYRARLYIHALLSTNGAEVGIFITAALAGWPIPLTAVQLLVINLLGDSWLSIALATEKEEKDVMQKPPRPADESVITSYMWFSITLQSIVATIVMMIAFLVARDETRSLGIKGDEAEAIQQTAIFIAFMAQKILRSAFTARSLRSNIWEIGFFTNQWSLLAALVSAGMAALAIYVLPVGMTDIPSALWPILLGIGFIPAIIEEAVKFTLKFIPTRLK